MFEVFVSIMKCPELLLRRHMLYLKLDEDINHAVDRTESHYIPSIIIFCNKCGKEWSSWKGEMIS